MSATGLCAQLPNRHIRCLKALLSRQQRNTSSYQASRFNRRAYTAQTATRDQHKLADEIPSKAQFTLNYYTRKDTRKDAALEGYLRRNPARAAAHYESDEAISIAIDGAVHNFDPVLLRDLCACPLCIDQSTRQKLFVTADIPLDIRAADCVSGPETFVVSWSSDVNGYGSDHKTEIPLSTLRRIVQYGKPVGQSIADRDLPRRVYWDEEGFKRACPDFSYDSYMQDDTALLHALRQLQIYGLLFVHSVPEDEKSVEALAERIGPLKTTFYGRTWDVRSVPEAKNVAYTAQNLGFHMDLLYMEQPPHLQLLHCIRSSSAGGASLFTDSFRAATDLYYEDRSQFDTLCNTRAAFHYDHPGSHYYHQFRSVIEETPRTVEDFKGANYTFYQRMKVRGELPRTMYDSPMDFVSAVSWSPPFQAPFALDRDISTNTGGDTNGKRLWNEVLGRDVRSWHRAAHRFNTLIHRPENIYERLMKPGECVILDNRRVLHARKAFEVGDAGKERRLRGAYIDKDPYLSKLRVLTEQDQDLAALLLDTIPTDAEPDASIRRLRWD